MYGCAHFLINPIGRLKEAKVFKMVVVEFFERCKVAAFH
jgi:hypothetical protein